MRIICPTGAHNGDCLHNITISVSSQSWFAGDLTISASNHNYFLDKMAVSQKAKFNVHSFQSSWRNEYGFVQHKHHAVRTRCCQGVVFSTSSIQRYFQMKHEKHFKDEADKAKSMKRAIVRYGKQSSVFTNIDVNKKNQATEGSYKTPQCVAQHGKSFTDEEYIRGFAVVQMFCSMVSPIKTK